MGDVGNDSLLRLPVSRESKVGQICVRAETLKLLTEYFSNFLVLTSVVLFDGF